MNRIRVVHAISDTNIGGAGVLLCNLLRHTDRDRFEPIVLLPTGSALIPRLESLGVLHVCYGAGNRDLTDASARLRELPELVRILRRLRPKILHTHASLAARIAGTLCRIPIRLMTRHCAYPPPSYLCRFPWKQGNGVFQCLLTHRFIAVARAAKTNLTDTGIPENRVTVIVNGSDPIREVSKEELSALRKRLGIPDCAFVAGICARLEPCKDHETFLRAAKLCLDRDPSMRFLVVGKGSLERELKSLAETLGIAGAVVFAGFAEDTAPYFRLFSVNINCSVGTETSCLAVSEGYSAGLPAIVSDFGGNPDMVEDGVTGFVLPMRDPEAYAEKILLLRKSPDLLAALSENALARYRQKYTASGMTGSLEAVYEELLADQARILTRRLVTKKK